MDVGPVEGPGILQIPSRMGTEAYDHYFPIYLPGSDGTGCHDLSFVNVEFKASLFSLLFHPHQEAL